MKGHLGTVDYGGTFADVVASYYGPINDNPGYWSWFSRYFSGVSDFEYLEDVWTYRLCGDPSAEARYLVETGIYSGIAEAVGDIIT